MDALEAWLPTADETGGGGAGVVTVGVQAIDVVFDPEPFSSLGRGGRGFIWGRNNNYISTKHMLEKLSHTVTIYKSVHNYSILHIYKNYITTAE